MSKRRNTTVFVHDARATHCERFNYDTTHYTDSHTPLEVKCVAHDNRFLVSPHTHLRTTAGGCKMCVTESKRAAHRKPDRFLVRAHEVHGSRYNYEDVIYVNARTKVEIKCPRHGSFWMTPNNHTSHRQGCPRCSLSKGEGLVSSFLTAHGIEFITQHSFPDCQYKLPLRFDFWIPTLNTVIEYQGRQHFELGTFSSNDDLNVKGFIDTQIRDEIKRNYCTDRGVSLIVVRYDQIVADELSLMLG